jgi:hypothetical protein
MDGGRVLNTHLASFRQFLERERRESFRKKQAGLHFYTEDDIDMYASLSSMVVFSCKVRRFKGWPKQFSRSKLLIDDSDRTCLHLSRQAT